MIICNLGAEWKDPNKIPAAQILAIWRTKSEKGRYEAKLWHSEALDELQEATETSKTTAAGGSGDHEPDQAEVNAAQDGGHFARWGEAAPQHRGEHAGVHLGTRRV